MGIEQTKKVFLTVFMFAHGYASITANNSPEYGEEIINPYPEQEYRGAIMTTRRK